MKIKKLRASPLIMNPSSNQLFLLLISAVTLSSLLAVDAADPDPVQDFCVSVNETEPKVYAGGQICKDPKNATADDFYLAGGLREADDITGIYGTIISVASVFEIPGLNTMGLSLARVDYAPHGLNPPHIHSRATEMVTVLQGTILAGFMTSDIGDGKNRLFAKILHPGDVFMFPRGLLHFNYNVGKTKASALVAFNSQNPGLSNVPAALLESEPPIPLDVLTRSFKVDEELIEYLRSRIN